MQNGSAENSFCNLGVQISQVFDEFYSGEVDCQQFASDIRQMLVQNAGFIITKVFDYNKKKRKSKALPSICLKPSEWIKIISHVDCRKFNRVAAEEEDIDFQTKIEILKYSISLTNHLGCYGILLDVNESTDIVQLSQILSSMAAKDLKVWINLNLYSESRIENIWKKWIILNNLVGHLQNIGICITIYESLESIDDILWKKFLSESIKCIIFSKDSLRQSNSSFSSFHKSLLSDCWKIKSTACVRLNTFDQFKDIYFEVSRLFSIKDPKSLMSEFTDGFKNVLLEPLQPLTDNMQSEIYSIFEVDETKYNQYRKSISISLKAMHSFIEQKGKKIGKSSDVESIGDDSNSNVVVILVIGPGRGPLVTIVIEESEALEIPIELHAVEKNDFEIPTLEFRNKSEWNNVVKIHHGDVRSWNFDNKIHLIVSELLGSFGDNELSPEILDCTQRFISEFGLYIPADSKSYIAPIMSDGLNRAICAEKLSVREGDKYLKCYVSYLDQYFLIDEPKEAFHFTHPNLAAIPCYEKYQCLEFKAKSDATLHAFAGYFTADLLDGIELSTKPDTHTENLISWFPIVFPIRVPVMVKKSDIIEFHIWRRNNNHHVWYEWTITSPIVLDIHNVNGENSKMSLF
ncbi:MAG: Protein arginine N-methyltransferase 5 [Marteilia pararefringens]